jgi:hypothetical protein
MAVLASIVHSDPPPARSAGRLGSVIGALLSKDPARRPDAARASQLLADAAVPVPATAAPVGASSRPVPGGAGPAATPARTDPFGFLAAPPAPAIGGAATAQLLADAGPDLFPSVTGLGSFPPGAGPALFPAQADPAGRTDAGTSPLPVSMGAAPLPDGTAAGAGPITRPSAPTSPRRNWLAVGLAGAAIVVAGLAAGLVWSRVMAPSAQSGAGSGAPAAAAPLPPGYHWYTRPAAAGGKARAFTLAVPAGWQPRQRGAATYLWNPASGAIIGISPAPAAAGSPAWPTRVLKRAGLGPGAFASYRRIAGAPFLSHGRLGGAWRFTYRQPGTGAVDGLVVVTRASATGGGSFELTVTAPARHWLGTKIVFAEAVRTFSPGA